MSTTPADTAVMPVKTSQNRTCIFNRSSGLIAPIDPAAEKEGSVHVRDRPIHGPTSAELPPWIARPGPTGRAVQAIRGRVGTAAQRLAGDRE
jgi:hypothetical protein